MPKPDESGSAAAGDPPVPSSGTRPSITTVAVREALQGVATVDHAERILQHAVSLTAHGVVPPTSDALAAFVNGELRTVVLQTLGAEAAEEVVERMEPMLRVVKRLDQGRGRSSAPPAPPPARVTARPSTEETDLRTALAGTADELPISVRPAPSGERFAVVLGRGVDIALALRRQIGRVARIAIIGSVDELLAELSPGTHAVIVSDARSEQARVLAQRIAEVPCTLDLLLRGATGPVPRALASAGHRVMLCDPSMSPDAIASAAQAILLH